MIQWIKKKFDEINTQMSIDIIFNKNQSMRTRFEQIRWMIINEKWTDEYHLRWQAQMIHEQELRDKWKFGPKGEPPIGTSSIYYEPRGDGDVNSPFVRKCD